MGWLKEFHYRIDDCMPIAMFYFIVLVVAAICGSITGCFLIDDIGGSKGQHTCYVTTVEDAENLTWDSVLVWTKTDTTASNEDVFCVSDNDVRKKLELAARSKKLVTLLIPAAKRSALPTASARKYKNDFILWRWECNGGTSIIVDIEEE